MGKRRTKEPVVEKPPEPMRFLPVLNTDKYSKFLQEGGITVAEKKAFLESYYETGNLSLATRLLNRGNNSFQASMEGDPAFLADFIAIKNAQKHNLEQTMYQNGLKEKGYMDRITWLRRHFPKEYNPDWQGRENNQVDVIKELSSKLSEYDLVPKKQVIEGKEDDHSVETGQ